MARAPTQGNMGDGAAFLLTIAVFVAGVGLGGWYLWQEQHAALSAIAMQGLHLQLRVIHLFSDRYDLVDAQLLKTDPAKVSFPQLVRLAREVGRFYLFPSIGVVACLAAACLTRASSARFVRALDLQGLMREQVNTFRSPAAFVERRLTLVDIAGDEPRPLDRALSAAEWIERWAQDKQGQYNELGAWAELARQLGDPMRGATEAAPHVRCMLAAFSLHRAQRREQALAFLGDLSASLRATAKEGAAGPTAPLAFPDALVAKADNWIASLGPALGETMAKHGFTTPATMSVLIAARLEGGVLAPAQFAFLKLVDRRLWYALHSLGSPADMFNPQLHPAPRVEAIGARDHWAAERVAGGPLRLPSIERALLSIAAAGHSRAAGI